MDRGGYAGTAPERVFQVNWTTVLLQEIAERFIGEFLKVLHLVVPEQIQLPPGLFIELHALARHQFALVRRAAEDAARS